MNFLQESVLRRYFAFLLLFLALLTGFGILYGTNCIGLLPVAAFLRVAIGHEYANIILQV